MPQPGADTSTELLAIDHIALRVRDPRAVAGFLCEHLGMESSESDEGFSVVGAPGGRSRLFLFEADAPSEPGALQRIVLRVSDLERARALLPSGLAVDEPEPGLAVFQAPEGLEFGLTGFFGGGVDYDLDHIVLRVMDPDETTIAMAELGFVPRGGGLHVGDKQVRLQPGIRSAGQNELLGHIGVLVESIEPVKGQVLRAGLEFDELTLTPNELGVYLRGPERIRVEYSERR